MADKRNRILPTVYRTGDPVIDRNLDAIHEAFRRLSSANDDDHEVKADAADTGHASLREKLKDTATLVWSTETTAGVRRVKGDVQGIPAPDDHKVGVSAGDIAAGKWGPLASKARGDNISVTAAVQTDPTLGEQLVFSTIAQADPITFASTLYAAHLDDPKAHASVASAFYIVTGSGNEAALFEYDWTNVSPGVWRCNIIGASILQTYCRGVSPYKGMRIWAGFLGLDGAPLVVINPEDKPHTGIYEIVDPGIWYDQEHGGIGVSTYAVVKRVADLDEASEFTPGVVVQITGGDSWAGKYANLTTVGAITLETTPLEWSKLDSYTTVPSDNLLTASQLAQASENPTSSGLVASNGSPSEWLTLPTLTGTPNLDTYKAGRTEVWILAYLHTAGATGSIAWLECQVVRDPGGANTVLETITTSPIANLTDEIIKAHVDDATDRDLAGDGIALRIRARTDSATPVTISVTWSDPAHSTRVLTPLSLAVGGTTDHQALTMTSRGFVAGQEDAARRSRHPRRAIEDFSSIPATLSDGNLTPDPTADTTVISSEVTIDRIDSSRWPGGFCRSHKLFFVNGGTLTNQAGDSGSFLSLDLGNFEGLSEADAAQLFLYDNGIVDLMLIGGSWKLGGYYTGRKAT